MRICGLGGPELIVVALLGYIIFGPERAKDAALNAGRLMRKVTRSPWFADFSRMAKELRDLPNTLIRMAELEDTQAELKRNLEGLRFDVDLGLDADDEPDITSDPWGIQNAVSRTVLPSQRGLPTKPGKARDPADSVDAEGDTAQDEEIPETDNGAGDDPSMDEETTEGT